MRRLRREALSVAKFGVFIYAGDIGLGHSDREFFWKLAVDGDRLALLAGNTKISYRDLDRLAAGWQQRFEAADPTGSKLIALEFETTVEAIAAYIGALRCATPLLIVEPGQLDRETAIASTWHPELCVMSRPDGLSLLVRRSAVAPPPSSPHPDLKLLLSTSGSTGDPKLVRLSRVNIASNASAIARYLALGPDDRAATTLPLYYSYGLSVLNSYLASGGALVLTSRSVTEAAFWDEAAAAKVTSLAFVPHQFELLSDAKFRGNELPALRYVTQAGGRMAPDLALKFWAKGQSFGWDLYMMYGQTEAAPRISFVPPRTLPAAIGTIGIAIPGGRLWIEDEEQNEITKPNVAGELVYEGPNVMMGYAQERNDLALPAEGPVLRTGDIAERNDSGLIRVVGRLKRFVKLFGMRVSLDQIELLLREHGFNAAAIAVDEKLVLLLTTPNATQSTKQILAETYKFPLADLHVTQIPEIPILSSGKPDQVALKRIAVEVLKAAVKPQDAEALADIMAAATRRRNVQPTDSFVLLGGDSLSYLQVQMALEERLGVVPPQWETMTLHDLESLERTADISNRTSVVGVDIILRLVAICLIVAEHASNYPLFGGTWMLIAVMGFSAGRFQTRQILESRSLSILIRMLYPIVPIYILIISTYAIFRGSVPLSYFLFLGNYYVWDQGKLLQVYWFVSVYVQIVLFIAILGTVPFARRRISFYTWQFFAVICAISIVSVIGIDIISEKFRPQYIRVWGFFECLSVFLIGWVLSCMSTDREKVVTAFLCIGVLLNFIYLSPGWTSAIWLCATLICLWWKPQILVPRSYGAILHKGALITMFIYLFHQFVVHFVMMLDLDQPLTILLSLVLSVFAALVVKAGFDEFDRYAFRVRANVPAPSVSW